MTLLMTDSESRIPPMPHAGWNVIGMMALALMWPASISAFDWRPLIAAQNPVEQASGPIKEMRIATSDSLITLIFSPSGLLHEKKHAIVETLRMHMPSGWSIAISNPGTQR